MSRYYFHIKLGQVTVLDHEGLELPDLADAIREATRRAQVILANEGRARIAGDSAIVIQDDWDTVMEVRLEGARSLQLIGEIRR
jgi:hypothetical protein